MPRPDCPSVSTETPTQVSNIRPKALCSTGEFAVFAGDVRLQVRRAQPALKLDSRPGPNAINHQSRGGCQGIPVFGSTFHPY